MKLLLFILVIYSYSTYAFNDEKCKKLFLTHDYPPPIEEIISSSQFSSSWGECSVFGSAPERKQQFIAFNLDELKLDSARGGGEYIEAYASLSGCSLNTNDAFSKALQHNFTQIYGTSTDHDVEAVYNSIEQVIRRDQMLSRECRVRGS